MNNQETQLDFVTEQNHTTQPTKENDQDFENKLIKQKALSVVNTVSKIALLEELKRSYNIHDSFAIGYNSGLLFAVGYYDMSKEDQQKIDTYLNSN